MAGHGPLSGYKVLDFTQFESGTVCTESLAWMGAEVWKIERPERGELGRYSASDPAHDCIGFSILNMNKKSLTLNLKSPEGIEICKKLVAEADVLVENMSPGAIDRLGLGYEDCRKINPELVFASIKGFSKGPYEKFPAFNPVAAAMGGLPALNGEPDGMPYMIGISFADSGSGYMCAMAILGALLQREREGKGQKVDVSMTDTIIGFSRVSFEPYYMNNRIPPRRPGNGFPLEDIAPCDMYPTKGGGKNDYVYIYTSRHPGAKQWDILCDVIGRPELKEANDERMATPVMRFKHKDVVTEAISAWTLQHDKMEAMEILCGAGVPTGAVRDIDDISRDDTHLESGLMAEIDSVKGKIRVPGFVPRMSENTVEYENSPALGNADEEIYKGLLGMTDEEFNDFKAKKII